jgi:D-arabinose 1-dehydrogenase-like Zn-dependent alcohol dehydrogenase
MKAVVIRKPNDAEYGDLPQPQIADGQVLVCVARVGVCMSDLEIYDGTRPDQYVKYPCIPDHEWCGTVAEIGPGVRHLNVGDPIILPKLIQVQS